MNIMSDTHPDRKDVAHVLFDLLPAGMTPAHVDAAHAYYRSAPGNPMLRGRELPDGRIFVMRHKFGSALLQQATRTAELEGHQLMTVELEYGTWASSLTLKDCAEAFINQSQTEDNAPAPAA